MSIRLSTLMAFVAGAVIGLKWMPIRNRVTPVARSIEKETVRGFLATKDMVTGIGDHYTGLAEEVRSEA